MSEDYFTYSGLRKGQPLHTVVHVVDDTFVRDFCIATGDSEPVAGEPESLRFAPSGVVNVFSTMVLGNSGHDRPTGDIHARHEYEFLAPIPLGTTVTTNGHVTDMFIRNGRKWVEFSTLSCGEDGQVYAQCRCTLLIPE